MDKEIRYVQEGYARAARPYRDQKDAEQAEIPLFQHWLHHPQNTGKILELGCASGFPIGSTILTEGREYLGIDLSPEQITLAHTAYPHWRDHFRVAEMLQFCRDQPSHSYSGVVSLFSIRHLPRIYHVELYTEILRILTDTGLFLVDLPGYSDEGRDTWFTELPMYWSTFSAEWTKLTLTELGFRLVDSFEYVKEFNGQEERTLFHLYQPSA